MPGCEDVSSRRALEQWWFFSLIAALLLVRGLVNLWLWEPGVLALTWDDFSRVAAARDWAQRPFLAEPSLIWLPLHTYVLGSGFAVAGDLFLDDPMALAAMVHTFILIVSALLLGGAAHELFKSRAALVLVFALALFAPWVTFLSNSGLGEPVYYAGLALAAFGLARWINRQSLGALLSFIIGVVVATSCRYEAWIFAPLVPGAVLARHCLASRSSPGTLRVIVRDTCLASLAGIVPALWMTMQFVRTGDAIGFVSRSAAMFTAAYGAGTYESTMARLGYYPAALLNSDPVLVVVAIVSVFMGWRTARGLRFLACGVALHLSLFVGSALMTKALGAFNERFMFAYAYVLLPSVGVFPVWFAKLPRTSTRRGLAFALSVILGLWIVVHSRERPEEWTHGPDMLKLGTYLRATAVRSGTALSLRTSPGVELYQLPLSVQSGTLLHIGSGRPESGEAFLSSLHEELDDARVAEVRIGRFELRGVGAPHADFCGPAWHWTFVDESGRARELDAYCYAALEFRENDPPPTSRARLMTTIPAAERGFPVRIRALYGHGFQRGRVRFSAFVDGRRVWEGDIGDPSRWLDVCIPKREDGASTQLLIELVASPSIEKGYGWGRASTVLVTQPADEGC